MFTFGQIISNWVVHYVTECRSHDKMEPNLKASDRKAVISCGRWEMHNFWVLSTFSCSRKGWHGQELSQQCPEHQWKPTLSQNFTKYFPMHHLDWSQHCPEKRQGRCSCLSLFTAAETKIQVTHPRSQNEDRKGTWFRPGLLTFNPVFWPPGLSKPSNSDSS